MSAGFSTLLEAIASISQATIVTCFGNTPSAVGASPLVLGLEPLEGGVEAVALKFPHCLTAAAKEQLFDLTLGYTGRAFLCNDIAKMAEDDRQDHFDHTFGGDGIVFLIGTVMGGTCRGSDVNRLSYPQIYAHTNILFIHLTDSLALAQPSNKVARSDDACQPVRPVQPTVAYMHAICCDPDFGGRGFAKALFARAVQVVRPLAQYLALRTSNVAIVKLMQKACCSGCGIAAVFPVEPFEPSLRPDISEVAECLSKELKWTGLQCDTLIIRSAYPSCVIPVFKGKVVPGALSDRVVSLIDQERGDALVCIADL